MIALLAFTVGAAVLLVALPALIAGRLVSWAVDRTRKDR